MRRLDFLMTDAEDGRRVGKLVLSRCGVSAGQYARLKMCGGVLLDGAAAHADERVRAGQTLSLILPQDGLLSETPSSRPLRPFNVAYEDDDLLILDKPAPLSSMRSPRQSGPSLEDEVMTYLGNYRPVNRLDKGTSGLMVIAKSAYAQNALQKQLHSDAFRREYLAVVEGRFERAEGRIDLPIGKTGEGVRRAVLPGGKPCATRFEVLGYSNGRSLVRLRLETGRTHQIRVHMAAMHHPVTGDYLYGTPVEALEGRFALHSAYVALTQPVSGRLITCESELPPVLGDLLKSPPFD